jgi:hypothetical protein
MEEGGSMSDGHTGGAITSLEEVFLSREFGRAPAHRTAVGGAKPLDDPASADPPSQEAGDLHALRSPEPFDRRGRHDG